MSSEPKVKNDQLAAVGPEPLLTRNELIAMVGLIVVTMGVVFFLAQTDVLDWGSPWWTLFIGIPGLVFLSASVLTVRHQRRITPMAIVQFVIGLVMALIALSFVLDPTWSFTRSWTLFRGDFWDAAWRWGMVSLGAALLVFAVIRRSWATGIIGGAIAAVGLIFALNLDWGTMWPLAIIAAGIGILALLFQRH